MLVRSLVVVPLLVASIVGARSHPAAGHWEGTLSFRGDDTPVRVHVEERDGALAATLDLPELVMAWEPVPVEADAATDGVVLTLPFGLGPIGLDPEGERSATEREVGGDVLRLVLERAVPTESVAPYVAPYARAEVAFESGAVTLAGTLVLPPGEGPHPGIVLVHGSSAASRASWGYRSWADVLARAGVATLVYDRRDVGASDGPRVDPDLAPLVDDAVAAVRFLGAHAAVDAGRVGVKGGSQGAWIAAAAAARADVAFLVLTSAAAVPPWRQELQQIEFGMRVDGVAEVHIDSALLYTSLYFQVARTGEGWPLLVDALARAKGEPWTDYVQAPRTEDDLAWWRANHGFDAVGALSAVRVPTLVAYGGADWIVPPAANVSRMRALLGEHGTILVLDGADHRLEVPSGEDASGRWRWPRIAPELLPALDAWLREHVTGPGSAGGPR